MDKLDFPSFLESTGREIEARIQRAGFYQHPTGTGDARCRAKRQANTGSITSSRAGAARSYTLTAGVSVELRAAPALDDVIEPVFACLFARQRASPVPVGC